MAALKLAPSLPCLLSNLQNAFVGRCIAMSEECLWLDTLNLRTAYVEQKCSRFILVTRPEFEWPCPCKSSAVVWKIPKLALSTLTPPLYSYAHLIMLGRSGILSLVTVLGHIYGAQAQLSALPTCAIACFTAAISTTSCSWSSSDGLACLCNDFALQNNIRACVTRSCPTDYIVGGEAYLKEQCAPCEYPRLSLMVAGVLMLCRHIKCRFFLDCQTQYFLDTNSSIVDQGAASDNGR